MQLRAVLDTKPGARLRSVAGCWNCVSCVVKMTRGVWGLQLVHAPSTGGACAGIFVEPMQWMAADFAFLGKNDGKLLCPSCKAKLGSWNWIGVKYVARWSCALAHESHRVAPADATARASSAPRFSWCRAASKPERYRRAGPPEWRRVGRPELFAPWGQRSAALAPSRWTAAGCQTSKPYW